MRRRLSDLHHQIHPPLRSMTSDLYSDIAVTSSEIKSCFRLVASALRRFKSEHEEDEEDVS
ncbi:uncharacterized protein V6R79_022178 [Siganus canaliculatus]